MSAQPTNGTVYEGWLVDDGGSGYRVSGLGEFSKNGTAVHSTIGWSIPTHTPDSS